MKHIVYELSNDTMQFPIHVRYVLRKISYVSYRIMYRTILTAMISNIKYFFKQLKINIICNCVVLKGFGGVFDHGC